MHLVTSSIFLSSLAINLKPHNQELFLRGYLSVSLAWYIGQGRPNLDLRAFFSDKETAYPIPPGPYPTPHEKSLPSASSLHASTPNPWLPIIQTTLVHPDEHLPKLQRALAHYDRLYGYGTKTPSGMEDLVKEGLLDGLDCLDGTLFLRTAGLTAKRLGRMRDGETPAVFWDRHGFANKA
jgi:hypothetical protein